MLRSINNLRDRTCNLNLAQWLLTGWSGVAWGLVGSCLKVGQGLLGICPARSRQFDKSTAGDSLIALIWPASTAWGRRCLIHTFPSVRFRLLIQPVDATQAVIR